MINLVGAVLVRDDRVLLCLRSRNVSWYKRLWDLPGGHVEDGELPQDAVVRESREEIGIRIDGLSESPVFTLFDRDQKGEVIATLSVWRVVSWSGEPFIAEANAHDDLGWFTASDISELPLAHPEYRTQLEGLLCR